MFTNLRIAEFNRCHYHIKLVCTNNVAIIKLNTVYWIFENALYQVSKTIKCSHSSLPTYSYLLKKMLKYLSHFLIWFNFRNWRENVAVDKWSRRELLDHIIYVLISLLLIFTFCKNVVMIKFNSTGYNLSLNKLINLRKCIIHIT